MDHIAKDGLLDRVLAGSYPSGPSSVEMPEIWKMIVENRVAAYNVPSGIMFDMHREAAAHRPGAAAEEEFSGSHAGLSGLAIPATRADRLTRDR